MKLKSGDKVIITGINKKTEQFERSTLEKLHEQKFNIEAIIHIDIIGGIEDICFNTPDEWYSDFAPGIWTLNYFHYRPYFIEELKYLL